MRLLVASSLNLLIPLAALCGDPNAIRKVDLKTPVDFISLCAAEEEWLSLNYPKYQIEDILLGFEAPTNRLGKPTGCKDVFRIKSAGYTGSIVFVFGKPPLPKDVSIAWKAYTDQLISGGQVVQYQSVGVGTTLMQMPIKNTLPYLVNQLDDSTLTPFWFKSQRVKVCDLIYCKFLTRLQYESSKKLVLPDSASLARSIMPVQEDKIEKVKSWWKDQGNALLQKGMLTWEQPRRH